MRAAFFRAVGLLAEQNPDVYLLVGDLGFGAAEHFAKKHPKQFINVGVAEQNLIGIATGLAMEGKTVFAYAISNFPMLRCLEQIRNDVCYQKANVKIVTSGGGFAYGALGISHHVTEDFAIMRALPEMKVMAPADPAETELAVLAMASKPGPFYMRLGRSGEPAIHPADADFQIGKAITLREGSDLTLIAAGTIVELALNVRDRLAMLDLKARVVNMHTIKPLDEEIILKAARETQAIFTLEEHNILGGLGGAVAEVLAESGEAKPLFKRLAIPDTFSSHVGDQKYLRDIYGISEEKILETILDTLNRVQHEN